MKINKNIMFYLLLIIVTNTIFSQEDYLSYGKSSHWVKLISPNYNVVINDSISQSSFYYLLLDSQENILEKEYYVHNAVKVLNIEGVQNLSDLSIDFDPAYQKVKIHELKLIRNGEVIDRLKSHKFDVAKREKNMERHIYDGSLTAFVNISDVRVNDIIEYSYSVSGYNPIFNNKYASWYYLNYSHSANKVYNRILVPKNREFSFNSNNNAPDPIVINHKNNQEYIWELNNTVPFIYDVNTPYWYELNKSVELSEYKKWSDVANWGVKLYSLTTKDKSRLKKLIEQNINIENKDSLLVNIVRFVQDEIRYLGFENGINGIKPNNPIKVINQRFGDCKAKSFLLVEALKLYDYEAYPVLVNSNRGNAIKKALPSPHLFNHCIVKIVLNGQNVYIDPTLNNQGGQIEDIYVPNYVCGFVIQKDNNQLDFFPKRITTSTDITEEFVVKGIDKKNYLNVVTIYKGKDADNQRSYIANNSITNISKNYLNFYSAQYPYIELEENVRFEDDRNDNVLTVYEKYSIDSLWNKQKNNKNIIESFYYPQVLDEYIYPQKSPKRSMPYYLSYPINIKHRTIVNLPTEWGIKKDTKTIKTNSFEYDYKVNYNHKVLTIDNKYKTLKNFIEAEEVDDFINKHKNITNTISYQLTYDTSEPKDDNNYFLIPFVIVVGFFGLRFLKNNLS